MYIQAAYTELSLHVGSSRRLVTSARHVQQYNISFHSD